jgi:hypothetical protein
LTSLDISPTFTNGAFTNVNNFGIRINNSPLAIFYNNTSVNESIRLYNANGSGNTGSSIIYRNGLSNIIWNTIDFIFPSGGGGNILFKTSKPVKGSRGQVGNMIDYKGAVSVG